MAYKKERSSSVIKEAASAFLSERSGEKDLITVTSVRLNKTLTQASVCLTVYPEDGEEGVVSRLNRERGALAEYIKQNTRLSVIPFLTFVLDKGEKYRQHIDSLSQSS